MSALVGLQGSRRVWERPLAKPLDEAVWQAWVAKGRAQERRSSDARVKAVKWVSIAGLLAAAGLWSHLTPYEVVVRFIVAAGAMVVMFQAFHATALRLCGRVRSACAALQPGGARVQFFRRLAARCGGTSAVPFVASLAWRNVRTAHND